MGDRTVSELVPGKPVNPLAGVETKNSSIPKKRRALKIAMIVFVCLFILSVGTKILIGKYIFHKASDTLDEVIHPMIGSQLGRQVSGEKVNITSQERVNSLLSEARQHQRENFDRAKTGQPVEFYSYTQLCTKNGVTAEITEHGSKEFCDEGNGNINCGDCVNAEYTKVQLENLSESITSLYAESILLFMVESVNDAKVNFDEDSEGTLDVIGVTLGILPLISRVTVMWAHIIPMLQEGMNKSEGNTDDEQYFLWDENPLGNLEKLEEFIEKVPEVTEDQINALNFKDLCVGSFVETYETDYSRMNTMTAITVKIIESRNFLPQFEDACEIVEEYEKNTLLKTLERSKVETIPSMKLFQKYYLLIATSCPNLIYDKNARDSCDYAEQINKLFDETFGIVREEDD